MTNLARNAALWSPRVLGAFVAVFVSAFALDAVGEGLSAFLIHLAPGLVLTLAVALGYHRDWIGAVVFAGLAVFYAVGQSRSDWVLVISGPLLLVGVLFLVSWAVKKHPAWP